VPADAVGKAIGFHVDHIAVEGFHMIGESCRLAGDFEPVPRPHDGAGIVQVEKWMEMISAW
jgi:hypothetical protein